MCGRFVMTLPDQAMAQLFAARPVPGLPPVPRYNICPTQTVAAVVAQGGERMLCPLRWGFVPHWAKSPGDGPLLINARAETLAQKPAFAAAARARRCLLPASGFYEWTVAGKTRQPWRIARADGAVMAMAGVWQAWGTGAAAIVTCAIVTCAAGPDIAHLHHRQPLILPPEAWALWLGEAGHGAARLMQPSPPGSLTAQQIPPEALRPDAPPPDA